MDTPEKWLAAAGIVLVIITGLGGICFGAVVQLNEEAGRLRYTLDRVRGDLEDERRTSNHYRNQIDEARSNSARWQSRATELDAALRAANAHLDELRIASAPKELVVNKEAS